MSFSDDLQQLQNSDISSIDKDILVELNTIKIDQEQDDLSKLKSYVQQIKNPYCYTIDGTPIKVTFANKGAKLNKLLEDYFISLNNV